MRSAGIFFLVVVGLIGGLIWQMPLSFALRQSGIASSGVSWTQARGTVWNGQVTDIAVQRRKIGALELNLRPASLLSGSLSYEARWVGPIGQGFGNISVSSNRYSASNVSLAVSMSDIPDLVDELKQAGATFRMSQAEVIWERYNGCVEASGSLQSDVVRLVGHQLQKDWPDLTGTLSCENGDLLANLFGESAQGEQFDIVFYLATSEPVRYRANIRGVSPDVENALTLYGFKFENGAFTLHGNSVGGNAH